MASLLKPQDCGSFCQEEAEFSLNFVISTLLLMDVDKFKKFEDILIAITFDGNVFKIENFEEKEEGGIVIVGRGLDLRLSPEQLAEKLRKCPIMINLSRGCNDLGTVKLNISECFVDAIMCEEFSSETCNNNIKFIKDDHENATITLVFYVSRKDEDNLYKGLKKPKKAVKVTEDIGTDSSFSISCSATTLSRCSNDDLIDNEDMIKRPTSSNKSKSTHSKCLSDIATSLDIRDYSDNQQTFCNGCGRFSISGVTCDNKNLLASLPESSCKSEMKIRCRSKEKLTCKASSRSTVLSSGNCKKLVNRVCSECFEDLSVIPDGAPCPKCAFHAQLHRKLVSFKSKDEKSKESEKIRGCIKSIIEEMFLETKDRLVKDWRRLKRKPKKHVKKAKGDDQRSSKLSSKANSKPRCMKTLKTQRKSKFTGLRKKHPGVVLGHHFCQGSGFLVPKNMGWLWNVETYGLPCIRRGWRPGAVKRSVAKIMKVHLTPPAEPAPIMKPQDPPTLRVQKKNGGYMILMNPLGEDAELTENLSPIVFKIMKSEEGKKRSQALQILKERRIVKCCKCSSTESCDCLTDCEKKHLKCELAKVSKELGLKFELKICDLKDSSDSEVDVEFTPPSAAALKNPCSKRKPIKVSYAQTQYEVQNEVKLVESASVPEIKLKKTLTKSGKSFVEDKSRKAGKTMEKSGLKAKEKSEKGVKIKVEKVVSRNGRQRVETATTEKEEKSKQQLQRRKLHKKASLLLRDSPSKKCCNFCAPKCDEYGCQPTIVHRYTTNYNPMYAQCPPQTPACARYIPIYY